jgi:hypothetical protein
MSNQRHRNRRALIVRLDKLGKHSVWKGINLEGIILSVDYYRKRIDSEECYYEGEVLSFSDDVTCINKGEIIGITGIYTILFSRAFNTKELEEYNRLRAVKAYGRSIDDAE